MVVKGFVNATRVEDTTSALLNRLVSWYLDKQKLIRQVPRTLHKKSPVTRGTLTRKPLAIGLPNELSSLQYSLLLVPGQVSVDLEDGLRLKTLSPQCLIVKDYLIQMLKVFN